MSEGVGEMSWGVGWMDGWMDGMLDSRDLAPILADGVLQSPFHPLGFRGGREREDWRRSPVLGCSQLGRGFVLSSLPPLSLSRCGPRGVFTPLNCVLLRANYRHFSNPGVGTRSRCTWHALISFVVKTFLLFRFLRALGLVIPCVWLPFESVEFLLTPWGVSEG